MIFVLSAKGTTKLNRKRCFILFLPFWIFGVWFVWHYFSTGGELRKLEAKCHNGGIPVRLAELNTKYASVPSHQNAAVVYWNAFTNLSQTSTPQFQSILTNTFQKLDDFTFNADALKQIAELISGNPEGLRLLHNGAKLNRCRYPIDLRAGWFLSLPHLEKVQTSAQLLALEAIHFIGIGNREGAIRSIQSILSLGNSLTGEPVAKSQGCRAFCNQVAIRAITLVLQHGPLEDVQLIELIEAFRKVEQTTDMSGAFWGEFCVGMEANHKTVIRQLFRDAAPVTREINVEIINALYAVSDREYADKLYYGHTILKYLNALKNPFPIRLQMLPDPDEAYRYAKRHGYTISAYCLPWDEGIIPLDAGNIARLRAIQTVLAIERFRLGNEMKLPQILSDLCPRFMATVPQDPFDGRLLRYKMLPLGYVVYSIGKDQTDNGGEPRRDRQPGKVPFDVPVTIKR